MDGLREGRMKSELTRRNRLTGIVLMMVALGMLAYSIVVIRHRGALGEPKNLTKVQKILRGL